MTEEIKRLEELVALCKRRGFVYPSAEIYGGTGAIYDFGPYGWALKHNIKKLWNKRFVLDRDDVIRIESAIVTRREVLKASGHEAEFVDPLIECKKCHARFREDELEKKACSECGGKTFTPAKQFNLMFKTHLGPVESVENIAYLRPETAQGMFTNFKTIVETTRRKVPFGIAQIGKSFRNEITTGQFLFRLREFEIAEIEYFVRPGEDQQWFHTWVDEWQAFFVTCGLKQESLRRHDHPKEELAHYSKATTDFQYHFPFGWSELAGVANRTDYDLTQHQQHSGKDLSYFDEAEKKKYLPFVIEPTLGIERLMFAVLTDALDTIRPAAGKTPGVKGSQTPGVEEAAETEYVLRLKPALAPVKAAVFPLVNKDGLPEIAQEIYHSLRANVSVEYDSSGSIGRRYRRQDEIGTPWCITVDGQTKDDQTVTVRDRDSMQQERIPKAELVDWLEKGVQ